MIKNPISTGVVLFIITISLFFITRFLFPGADFFNNSLAVNSFILPIFYCAAAFLSVRYVWKRGKLTFKDAFSRSFLPMFIGGILSVISIFLYLNFADTPSKKLLNEQFVDRNRTELTQVYKKERSRLKTNTEKLELDKDYRKSLQSFTQAQVADKDLLTFRYFAFYLAAILIFYTIISLFLGFFFRSKND